MHARPGGTYLQVEVHVDTTKEDNGKRKSRRPSGMQPRRPSIQNFQARRQSSPDHAVSAAKPRPANPPGPRNSDTPEARKSTVRIEAENLNARGILRPLGVVSRGTHEDESVEIFDANDEDIESLDREANLDELAYVDEASDDLLEAPDDEPDPTTAVRRLQQRLRASIPVGQLDPIRERISLIAKNKNLRMALPNFHQIRSALGIASFTALAISMAVSYHVPTSLYGLDALLKIAAVAMGLAVLSLPVKLHPLRLLERWLLALCTAAVIFYGDPVSLLAKLGAESRVADSDPGVRASGVRTLAALGRKDFSGMNLQGTDLSGTDLSFTSLVGANLDGADLSYVKLTRAQLERARFRGADLNGADLWGASAKSAVGFTEAICTERTKMPASFACEQGKPVEQFY